MFFDLYGCNPESLTEVGSVEPLVLDAVSSSGATIIGHRFHQFEPVGVSGIVLIAESHVAFHTWPENGYAAFDVFTCSDAMDIRVIEEALKKGFGASRLVRRQYQRGEELQADTSKKDRRSSSFTNGSPGETLLSLPSSTIAASVSTSEKRCSKESTTKSNG